MRETIIITGGSRGIGAASSLALASPHREIVLLARTEEDLQRQAERIRARGGHATYRVVDLGSRDSVSELGQWMVDAFERIDGLILNAGISNDVDFDQSSRDLMEREMAVNYHAPADLLSFVLPDMKARGSGKVVVVGSLTAFVPFPGNASYTASKAALQALIRSVRIETRESGVHLGMVLPGLTETDLTRDKQTLLPSMSAATVGRAVARCYDEERALVVPGRLNQVAARLFSAFPETSDRLLSRVASLLVPSS